MKGFVITILVLQALGAFIIICQMITSKYPRERSDVGVGVDCAELVIKLAFVAWTIYLLNRLNQ